MISPATEGEKEMLPGTLRLPVHFLSVPGGQTQFSAQAALQSMIGVIGVSFEYTTFRLSTPLARSSFRMTFARGQTEVL